MSLRLRGSRQAAVKPSSQETAACLFSFGAFPWSPMNLLPFSLEILLNSRFLWNLAKSLEPVAIFVGNIAKSRFDWNLAKSHEPVAIFNFLMKIWQSPGFDWDLAKSLEPSTFHENHFSTHFLTCLGPVEGSRALWAHFAEKKEQNFFLKTSLLVGLCESFATTTSVCPDSRRNPFYKAKLKESTQCFSQKVQKTGMRVK